MNNPRPEESLDVNFLLERFGKKLAQAEFEAAVAEHRAARLGQRVAELEQALGDAMTRITELEVEKELTEPADVEV